MKSVFNKIARIAKNQVVVIVLGAVMASVVFPATAFASDSGWSLDSTISSARLYLGSAKQPQSVNVGVARVVGTVDLDPTNTDNSVVELAIYPADEGWATDSNGNLPSGYVPDSSDHTLLTFKSAHTEKTADGTLKVTGNLTLTRVERTITADATEAYAGPVYGEPVLRSVTQEVTFVFPEASTALARLQNHTLKIAASTRIAHEDFKQLSGAIEQTNWPSVVANESCNVPSVGEDYSGIKCTGTEIATTTASNCQAPASVGEDYSGAICARPGDQTTIALNLVLTNANAGTSAEAVSSASAAQ